MEKKSIPLVIFIITLLVSCSEPTFEEKAKSHLKEMAEIIVNDPKSLIVQDEQVVFSNDSVCFICFRAKAKNRLGNYTQAIYEYYYVRTNHGDSSKPKEDYYGAYCINNGDGEGQTRVDLAVDNIMDTVENNISNMNEEEKTKARANAYYLCASMRSVVDNRKVK